MCISVSLELAPRFKPSAFASILHCLSDVYASKWPINVMMMMMMIGTAEMMRRAAAQRATQGDQSQYDLPRRHFLFVFRR